MGAKDYNNYNFDVEKIIFHLNGIFEIEDKAEYLTKVLEDIDKTTSVNKNGNQIKESSENYIAEKYSNEIIGAAKGLGKVRVILELELDKLAPGRRSTVLEEIPVDESINKIFIKSGITDIVRIFEAMKKAGIISSANTDVGKIARIFFNDPLEAKKFQANYNAIKREIKNTRRNSNSNELALFVKDLIEKSFDKKDAVLEEIIKHIEQLQKKII